jgi:hypothetical protein
MRGCLEYVTDSPTFLPPSLPALRLEKRREKLVMNYYPAEETGAPRRALSYDSAAFFLAIFSARAFASFSFLFFGSPEIK